MKRSRIKRKPRRNDRPDIRAAYRAEHESCACCPNNWRTFGTWLEVAHILGGRFGRHDVRENYLMLCRECHHERLIGKQQLGWYLALKQELGELDREALQSIIRRCGTSFVLPEAVEVPKHLRERN